MIRIYHNPRCKISREALSIIASKHDDYTIIPYLVQPLEIEELKDILVRLNLRPKDILRTKDKCFLPFRKLQMEDEEWLRVIHQHPELMERPIVIKNRKAIIARPAALLNDWL
jgi:arsenate reductase (glutaredoxin)